MGSYNSKCIRILSEPADVFGPAHAIMVLTIFYMGESFQDFPGPVVIKHFFMLNSTEHEISTAHKS